MVLSREEIDAVLAHLRGARALAVRLLYGCGPRLSECPNLRMHCFNVPEAIPTVHDGKGRRNRTVPLPQMLMPALEKQMGGVRRLHEQDLSEGFDGALMPFALGTHWISLPKNKRKATLNGFPGAMDKKGSAAPFRMSLCANPGWPRPIRLSS